MLMSQTEQPLGPAGLLSLKETIGVYTEKDTIYSTHRQDAALVIIKPAGSYSYHSALKG
jgi:hypothetical protein